jgi:hypothetical protein
LEVEIVDKATSIEGIITKNQSVIIDEVLSVEEHLEIDFKMLEILFPLMSKT